MFVLVIYLLSSAPAFVVALKSEEELSFRIVRRVYRPLFDVAPEFTSNYLRLCGVSDIEMYFVLEPPKGEAR
jgi:hypothetical protein